MWLNSMGWFGKLSINCSKHAEMDEIFLVHRKLAGKCFVCWETISGRRMSLLPSFGQWRGLRTPFILGWPLHKTPKSLFFMSQCITQNVVLGRA